MKRFTLVGFPDGLVNQDIAPCILKEGQRLKSNDSRSVRVASAFAERLRQRASTAKG